MLEIVCTFVSSYISYNQEICIYNFFVLLSHNGSVIPNFWHVISKFYKLVKNLENMENIFQNIKHLFRMKL